MYFTEHGCFYTRKISSSGVISSIAGTGSATYSGDGGPATAAALNYPYDVTVDSTGTTILTDYTLKLMDSSA